MASLVYVGAGLDVRPVRALTHIKKFIYMDSRPATQQPDSDVKFQQYDRNYVDDFLLKMERLGFDWVCPREIANGCFMRQPKQVKPFVVKFSKDDVELHYYFNTFFPKSMSQELVQELSQADTLNIAGYFPPKDIMNYMKTPCNIICWEDTVYQKDEYEPDSIVNHLFTPDSNVKSKVKSLTFYEKAYVGTPMKDMDSLENFRTRDKKQELSGGKQKKNSKTANKTKLNYKNKQYEIKTGSKGGKYIIVNGEKKYI